MPVSLEDVSAMSRTDGSGMLRQITALPDQLRSSLTAKVDLSTGADRVCICGLGGSAMGGDILADHMDESSEVVSAVVRNVELPRWVDKNTLTVLISYSGNTRETLEMFSQARERGCPIVAITSGGRLLEFCRDAHIDTIEVPGGIQPRAALGHLLGSAAVALESAGICPVATELKDIIPKIEEARSMLVPDAPSEVNVAKQVAMRLQGRTPFVYASRPVRTAAKRWQTQINENSKMLCGYGEMPEIDHNQVVGWVDGKKDPRSVPVFLRSAADRGMMANIVEATIGIFDDFQLGPVVVDLEGGTSLENTMLGIIIGDFVSFYLAMLNGVDPTPVSSISVLKKRLG